MNRITWLLQIGLLVLLAVSIIGGDVAGQEASPFEEDAPAAEKTPASDSPAPSVDPLADEQEHPIIRGLRASDPKSLDELTRALRLTMQLGRGDEFKRYAKIWLELKASDTDLTALNRKYGAAMFFEMARLKDLQPEGAQVADAVLDAAARVVRDPARLSDLIGKLGAEATRAAALRGLREAGEDGIVALIGSLAVDDAKVDRAAVRDALTQLGRGSIGPLVAALSAPQAPVRADAAEVLGRLRAREAVIHLAGLAATEVDTPDRSAARQALQQLGISPPTRQAAAKILAQRVRDLLAGELPGKLDENNHIGLWRWDAMTQSPRFERYPQREASLLVADRFSQQLLSLSGDNREHTRLALLVRLEADKTVAGFDEPLPQGPDTAWALAHSLGTDVIEGALVEALDLDRPTAIAALLEVLGTSGRPELLTKYPSAESPIITALGYPDRRVQFAALKAIVELDPVEAYPGSSRVAETMQFLLSTTGQPRVLVGHPRLEEARRIGSLYSELDYEADGAATGSAVIRKAAENADYELILISETIDGPDIQQTVQALRKDPRTARIPLGILPHYLSLEPRFVPDRLDEEDNQFKPRTREEELGVLLGRTRDNPELLREEQLKIAIEADRHAPQRMPGAPGDRAAELVELAVVVPVPQTPESLTFVHNRVMELAPTRFVPADLRLEQAAFVLDVLNDLMSRRAPPTFYNYLRLEEAVVAALQLPPLAMSATELLSHFHTQQSQLALVEQASLPTRPIEEREAALKAFDESVRRNGLLLTTSHIRRQYERLEGASDEQSRALLENLIATLEAPSAAQRQANARLLQSIRSSVPRPELIPVEKATVAEP